MKLLSLVTLLFATATAYASVGIQAPKANASIRQGQMTDFEIARIGPIEDCKEHGVTLELVHCGKTCPNAHKAAGHGHTLYDGKFDPTEKEVGGVYQSIERAIPKTFKTGKALLVLTNKCQKPGESLTPPEVTSTVITIAPGRHTL
ncbi:hypothetical protein BJ138DRAFT_1102509 [Hygrophoropsis aurantiaca]|uniref:Uncharacterized protein n=1 Tax=Hygrophoropsis aurantiaca TaxID=72124 RepID=A0ACB8A9E8_9AGAM|nr:hypothetical protein BJ138DRAFT_1102509 [Hygrophoropsis aurantiaca]